MANLILALAPNPPDSKALLFRIKELEANRREGDPAWWNDLAGAHLRLGRPLDTLKLLEPLREKFANDYGLHANLGTAYHLLGRYAEAEKEIARDLEINPDAHFGLERYHLALLQYLVRDVDYRKTHVYVDEYTQAFMGRAQVFGWKKNGKLPASVKVAMDEEEIKRLEGLISRFGDNSEVEAKIREVQQRGYLPPGYRYQWDLASDPKFQEGVMYMASLSPREPACFVMLGIACAKTRRYNLAASAFEKAVSLGSPQSELLNRKADGLRVYVRKSLLFTLPWYLFGAALVFVIGLYVRGRFRTRSIKKKQSAC